MIKSAPLGDKPLSEEKPENHPNDDFVFMLLSAEGDQWKLEGLQDHLGREWYEPWPQLEWISNSLIPDLLKCIAKVPIFHKNIVLKFATLFRTISFYFGSGFVQSQLIPAFKKTLPLLDSKSDAITVDNFQAQTDLFIYTQSGLVPTYFLGVLDKSSPNIQVRNVKLQRNKCFRLIRLELK